MMTIFEFSQTDAHFQAQKLFFLDYRVIHTLYHTFDLIRCHITKSFHSRVKGLLSIIR